VSPSPLGGADDSARVTFVPSSSMAGLRLSRYVAGWGSSYRLARLASPFSRVDRAQRCRARQRRGEPQVCVGASYLSTRWMDGI